MQSRISVFLIAAAALLAFSSIAFAQEGGEGRVQQLVPSIPPPDGWGNCPRCQNNTDREKDWKEHNVDTRQFNPKDLTGVWGWNGVGGIFRNPPPMTEEGKARRQETMGAIGPDGTALHSKDTSGRGAGSAINCDPYGWPRLHTYNYGMEFVMLPNRILQFFELNHTWRTIWTDGRKLPENPPEPRWLGWTIGHWEGDELVVESSGYDDRSWLDASNPDGGWVHSDEMKVVERYKRTKYGTLEAQITVIDPRIYTQPWVTAKQTIRLVPTAEIWENFCAPSDYQQFNDEVFKPAAGVDQK
jgi:hypothetical protein